ncbi:hypothetical protein FHN45_22950 [Salmonella enterica]|nr:hypothetical protein [Salmonella enterica]EBD1344202.1 hypothetical protein [Salmonella enterica]EKK8372883.1 hypothetical protein [Salmonella enterica]
MGISSDDRLQHAVPENEMSVTYNPLTDKQIALAVELAKARVEYVRKHGAPLLNNEEEVTLIALRELQESRRLLKAAERRIAGLEARAIELPPAWWVRQGKAPEFLAYPINLVIDAIRAAGIGVKGA